MRDRFRIPSLEKPRRTRLCYLWWPFLQSVRHALSCVLAESKYQKASEPTTMRRLRRPSQESSCEFDPLQELLVGPCANTGATIRSRHRRAAVGCPVDDNRLRTRVRGGHRGWRRPYRLYILEGKLAASGRRDQYRRTPTGVVTQPVWWSDSLAPSSHRTASGSVQLATERPARNDVSSGDRALSTPQAGASRTGMGVLHEWRRFSLGKPSAARSRAPAQERFTRAHESAERARAAYGGLA